MKRNGSLSVGKRRGRNDGQELTFVLSDELRSVPKMALCKSENCAHFWGAILFIFCTLLFSSNSRVSLFLERTQTGLPTSKSTNINDDESLSLLDLRIHIRSFSHFLLAFAIFPTARNIQIIYRFTSNFLIFISLRVLFSFLSYTFFNRKFGMQI